KTLYYLAQKTPGYASDRFDVMALNLAMGESRELNPDWDRSASNLQVAADGSRLYVTAAETMQTPLFAISTADGTVTRLTQDGHVGDYTLAGDHIVVAHDDMQRPAELVCLAADGAN